MWAPDFPPANADQVLCKQNQRNLIKQRQMAWLRQRERAISSDDVSHNIDDNDDNVHNDDSVGEEHERVADDVGRRPEASAFEEEDADASRRAEGPPARRCGGVVGGAEGGGESRGVDGEAGGTRVGEAADRGGSGGSSVGREEVEARGAAGWDGDEMAWLTPEERAWLAAEERRSRVAKVGASASIRSLSLSSSSTGGGGGGGGAGAGEVLTRSPSDDREPHAANATAQRVPVGARDGSHGPAAPPANSPPLPPPPSPPPAPPGLCLGDVVDPTEEAEAEMDAFLAGLEEMRLPPSP